MRQAPDPVLKGRFLRGVSVAVVAVALAWPALWNGFPLIFPDALGYLRQSHGILQKLRGRDVPYWSYEIMRSEIYSASMSFLHHGANLWPIVALQAVLAAWILWLVIRAFRFLRPVTVYVSVSSALAALTGVGWYVSSPMPDILGPLLYLVFFLLVMAREELRTWETAVLALVAWWAITAHSVHLLLAGALCVLFALLRALRWPGMLGRGRRLALFGGVLLLAVVAQIVVHRRLYHEASLLGRPPAFLMARLIGDGPARVYLQQNCAGSQWFICRYANKLPMNEEQFLWEADGIETTATPDERKQLGREEMPLLLATMRAYPVQQTTISLKNFGKMLVTMGPWDYWSYAAFTPGYLDFSVRGLNDRYRRTRQARNDLPQSLCRAVQGPVIAASVLIVACLLPGMWRRRNYAALALAAVVCFILPANAFLSGVISTVDPRLQDRVSWLMALLAGVMLCASWRARTWQKKISRTEG